MQSLDLECIISNLLLCSQRWSLNPVTNKQRCLLVFSAMMHPLTTSDHDTRSTRLFLHAKSLLSGNETTLE